MSDERPAYRCHRCDCRIWFEEGEWGCACWTVSAESLAAGLGLPDAWTPPPAVGEGGRMSARSRRPEVRNPVLALPAMARVQALPPPVRAALRAVLLEIRQHAHERAQQSWRRHKAPMAAYWKAVAVYAGHIARNLRDRP